MKILGIMHDVTNTTAAIIDNGKVVAGVAEERLIGLKKHRFFPFKAIQYCLDEVKCSLSDIDYIAHGFNPAIHSRQYNLRFSNIPRWRAEYFTAIPNSLSSFYEGEFDEYSYQELKLKTIDGKKDLLKIYYIDHHLAHAANAFFLSPFNEAAIFTADGRGEHDTGLSGIGQDQNIRVFNRIEYPHSIGLFYGTFTEFLGYRINNDEWKVMALGALSNDEKQKHDYYKKLSSLVILKGQGKYEIDLNFFKYFMPDQKGFFSDALIELIGKPRMPNQPLSEEHYALAYAVQKVTEDTLVYILDYLYKKTNTKNLTVSGGVFMNSLFNGKIKENTKFDNIFISSCPDDIGNSIGAAMYLYNHILGKKRKYTQKHNYYGPGFSNDEIEKHLIKYKINYKYEENISKYAAQLISDGFILGWFQGKMEFGERALGNRSILADPRNDKIKDKVNAAVKYREHYRPFAPAILKEYAQEYFDIPDGVEVPFMEQVYFVKEEKRKEMPAVVHYDGTGRLQTVRKEHNKLFHDLITEFHKITHLPVLLNTSFNLNGEPIVCSPKDAIRTFYSCGLDYLIMGNYVIDKEKIN